MNPNATGGNLTRRLVEALGGSIVGGRYGADTPFPIEAEIGSQFNASRSVVREAVKMLTAKGLLSSRPRRGTVVEPETRWNLLDPDVLRWLLERKFSYELLTEFSQMRMAVEPTAAALAAQRRNGAEIEAIRAALLRMEAAQHGQDDPLGSDIAFHVAVLQASGNRFYRQLRDMIDTALRFSIRVTNASKGVSVGSVTDHAKVLHAIEAGDPEAAQAAMRALLEEAIDLIAAAREEATSADAPGTAMIG